MINKLAIRNFQSHKETILDLHPGVNAIVGASDSGKTAILRALNWLVTNRPSGDSFRSSWGGTTSVVVETDEHSSISRIKSDRENLYELDGVDFKAMGASVPEPVAAALNLSELNVQRQMDAPFLLSGSPGEVARTLNEVAGLEDIDKAIAGANRQVTQARMRVEREQSLLREASVELHTFDDLDAVDRELAIMEKLEELGDAMLEKQNELGKLIEMERGFSIRAERYAAEAALLPELEALAAREREMTGLRQAAQKLTGVITNIAEFNVKLADGRNLIANMQAELTRLMPEVCPLCGQEIRHENESCKGKRRVVRS